MADLVPILEVKAKGNDLFRNGEYNEAIETYTEAIFMAETTRLEKHEEEEEKKVKVEVVEEETNEEKVEDEKPSTDDKNDNESNEENKTEENKAEEKPHVNSELDDLKAVLYGNRAACYKMLDDAERCLPDCDHALSLKTPNPKVRTRRSWALRKQGKANDALEELKKAFEEDPSLESSYSTQYAELQKEAAEETEKLKTEALGQLKELGNKFLGLFGMSTDNFHLQQNPDGGYNVQFKK